MRRSPAEDLKKEPENRALLARRGEVVFITRTMELGLRTRSEYMYLVYFLIKALKVFKTGIYPRFSTMLNPKMQKFS